MQEETPLLQSTFASVIIVDSGEISSRGAVVRMYGCM